MEEFRKNNLIFLKCLLMDHIYIVHSQKEDGRVIARKIDAPPSHLEELDPSKVVRLAEEQEKLFPFDISGAIEKQRQITFLATRKVKRKPLSEKALEKRLKGLSSNSMEMILKSLGEYAGTLQEEEEEEE